MRDAGLQIFTAQQHIRRSNNDLEEKASELIGSDTSLRFRSMTRAGKQRSRRSAILFLRNFARHPGSTGSVVASSRFLVRHMLRRLDLKTAKVIVELGPGTGAFTTSILRRLSSDAVLIAIEMDPKFARRLRSSIPDSRLRVVLGSASEVDAILRQNGLVSADYIVSGLPFANMSSASRHLIVHKSHQVLRPNGVLALFQYRRILAPLLRANFRHVRHEFQPLNIPPAYVFWCKK